MAFVKLDCGILDSTLWIDRECREVFLTALLMAVPREFSEPAKELQTRTVSETGWEIPIGWYGFVAAAGPGILRRAGVDAEAGLAALERLASPEQQSRSPEYEGRRMVRVNGGFVILNYMKYRDIDHGAAERMRRLRQRKKEVAVASVTPNGDAKTPNVTHADADADADADEKKTPSSEEPSDETPVKQLHGKIRKAIGILHEKRFGDKPQWDGSEGRILTQVIGDNTRWSWETWKRLITNRYKSKINSGRPRTWLNDIGKYLAGPLDRFDQPLSDAPAARGQPSKYVEVDSESPADVAQRQRGLI